MYRKLLLRHPNWRTAGSNRMKRETRLTQCTFFVTRVRTRFQTDDDNSYGGESDDEENRGREHSSIYIGINGEGKKAFEATTDDWVKLSEGHGALGYVPHLR